MNSCWSLAVVGGLTVVALSSVATGTVNWPGPDSYGYTGSSSTGNTYSTIKGNGGTLVTPADPAAATYDDRFYQVAMPFGFNFYGVTSNTAYVSTNGFISFSGTTNTDQSLNTQVSASYTNASFASATTPIGNTQVDRQMIAPWWDDMQFTSGQQGGIYTLSRTVSGVQEFVVEWASVAFFNSTTDGVSFQAILRSNGTMTFAYGDTASSSSSSTNGVSATIGIHDLGGTTANDRYLQWSVNQTGAVSNGLRIDIVPAPASAALLGVGGLVGLRRRRR